MTNFIKPCEGRVTSPFGYRIHPIKKTKSFHQGVDLAQTGNVPILASAGGVVTRNQALGTYGNVVMIVHKINGVTYETNYAHLKYGAKVIVGQRVKQGDIIGYMGNTGSSTAQHLHFEIHKGRWATGQPNAVDPLLYTSFPEVQDLQGKLNDIGYKLMEDGINGDNTTNAVKDFQTKQKLVVDGNAGPSTLAQLLKVFALANMPKAEVKGVSKTVEDKKHAPPSEWFAEKFKKAMEMGITNGEYPQRIATREEVVVMIVRALESLNK